MTTQQSAEQFEFKAAITRKDVIQGEARFNGDGDAAIARRTSNFVLTRSRKQLVRSMKEDIETFFSILELATGHVKDCEAQLALAEAAQARLFSVGDEITNAGIGLMPSKKKAHAVATGGL